MGSIHNDLVTWAGRARRNGRDAISITIDTAEKAAELIVQQATEIEALVFALQGIRDAHPTGSSWTHMTDGTWREACRDFQRIARHALLGHGKEPASG
ncbi:hypothetical protein ASC97_05735 [Rhizobium sp. Root1203]|nr:hypothetical protein ASC97_05735 [Rhizobium sp. Root1203]